jgi:hypothetical protein
VVPSCLRLSTNSAADLNANVNFSGNTTSAGNSFTSHSNPAWDLLRLPGTSLTPTPTSTPIPTTLVDRGGSPISLLDYLPLMLALRQGLLPPKSIPTKCPNHVFQLGLCTTLCLIILAQMQNTHIDRFKVFLAGSFLAFRLEPLLL